MPEAPRAGALIKEVDWRLRLDRQAEGGALLNDSAIEEFVVAVQADRHAQCLLRASDAGDVIEMRVREQDVANR